MPKKKIDLEKYLQALPEVPIQNKYNWIAILQKDYPEIWEIVDELCTRFYKKDKAITAKVPNMRTLAETVSAILSDVDIHRSAHSIANTIRDQHYEQKVKGR